MTTQEAINELQDNISNYPVANVVVWRGHQKLERPNGLVQIKLMNGKLMEFDTGIEMLEWLEKKYRDKKGNLKTKSVQGKFVDWLMENCQLSEDGTVWSYNGEDYTNEKLFQIFREQV